MCVLREKRKYSPQTSREELIINIYAYGYNRVSCSNVVWLMVIDYMSNNYIYG